ncbi:GIY-YIG nuclease family protein [Bacillus sp. FJAT-26390]|uniref:GIY-YIG nuclease family protein n=1 Tax=Bacillus sp. FJAT-26390 TaxID=1743142 RepID=UPI000807ED1A|nr:GIY-YIG nuclease family protein [Bacillus sp. FJAT-26390]OBZ10930.1 hypothetical protein A7975_18200 [Bacillus sp. FJAT-26390]
MFAEHNMNDVSQIESFVNDCEASLLDSMNVNVFTYPKKLYSAKGIKKWEGSEKDIDSINEVILNSVAGSSGVYALFTRRTVNEKWILRYIGHTKGGSSSRQRIRNHLVKKNKGTGAKLDLVKEAVLEGQEIGISFVKTKPDYLRLAVEAILIEKHSNILVWNTRGKKVKPSN